MKRCFVILSCLFLCSWSVEAAGHGHVTSQHSDEDISGSESDGDLSVSNGQSGPGAVSVVPEAASPAAIPPHGPNLGQRLVARLRNLPASPAHFNCRQHCTVKNCRDNDQVRDTCLQQCEEAVPAIYQRCLNARNAIRDCRDCTAARCRDARVQQACRLQKCPNIQACLRSTPKANYRDSSQVTNAERLKHIKFLEGHEHNFIDKYLADALAIAHGNLHGNQYRQVPAAHQHANDNNAVAAEDLATLRIVSQHYQAICGGLSTKFQAPRSRLPWRPAPQSRLNPQHRQTFADHMTMQGAAAEFNRADITVGAARTAINEMEADLQQRCFDTARRVPNAH
jgi:hypothetical protein